MKKNIFLAAIAALSLTACVGDLNQTPEADNVVDNVYENPTYRKSALAKIYGGFTLVGQGGAGSSDIDVSDAGASEFLRAWWSIQTVSTDECKCVWGDSWVAEIGGNAWSAVKNDAIYATYTRGMMMVAFANDFLRNTDDSDAEVAIERAEVRFLRAYAYWVLLDCFGNPPFVVDTDPFGTYKPIQTNQADLYNWLKAELTELTSDASALKAPHTQVYPRVDKGAAYGLLARLCLNHKTYLGAEDKAHYATARDAAEKVIAAYQLADNYKALFMGDNGENPDALKEIVYASCYDANKTQSYGGTSFLMLAGKGQQYALGIDGNWNGLVTNSEAVERLIGKAAVDAAKTRSGDAAGDDENVFSAIDARALVSLSDCDDKEMDTKNFANGWHVVKFNNNRFLDPATDYSKTEKFSSVDFPMIRAAEMYLVYAEAQARIDGGQTSDAKAVDCIKALQTRAGMQNPTVSTTVNLDQIFDEISRELFWEGQRRTTLIRYDRYSSASYLWPFKGGVKNGQGFAKYLELFPLPSDDLLANENLSQNEGYIE